MTTLVDNLDTERSWRGGEIRLDHERAGKGGGRGLGCFVRENQEGIQRYDLEIGIGGRQVTWG